MRTTLLMNQKTQTENGQMMMETMVVTGGTMSLFPMFLMSKVSWTTHSGTKMAPSKVIEKVKAKEKDVLHDIVPDETTAKVKENDVLDDEKEAKDDEKVDDHFGKVEKVFIKNTILGVRMIHPLFQLSNMILGKKMIGKTIGKKMTGQDMMTRGKTHPHLHGRNQHGQNHQNPTKVRKVKEKVKVKVKVKVR